MNIEHDIALKIAAVKKPAIPLMVAICGAADLGKSYLSAQLAETLCLEGIETSHLPLDSFLMNRSDRIKNKISGYQPEAYDVPSMKKIFRQFKAGTPLQFRPYDHTSGKQKAEPVTVDPSQVLLLDGLHSMHPTINADIGLSFFIYTSDDRLREIRRQADLVKRKQTPSISKKLEPLEFQRYKEWVEPYKKKADFLLFLKEKWRYTLTENKKTR